MSPATLTKVGNSMAVILPKKLRDEAQISDDTELRISSPRKGTVVITAIEDLNVDRVAKIDAIHKRIEERSKNLPPWPKGKTAQDLIEEARDERAKKYLSHS